MSVREHIGTPRRPPDIRVPYGGYHRRVVPPEDAELTHVGPGTPCGEYMRRFWWPVCLSEQVSDLPHAIRILGEDLVAFRDKSNRVGVLHRHCSHRGTSLEYGIPSEHGLRCCYHGWLFDVDGCILETPGEPPGSNLKESFVHGAYPALEYHGLVFAYLGPPQEKPDFPVLDTFEEPETRIKPYAIWHPCNYLQVMDNLPDFFHTCILHNGIGNAALARGEAETDLKIDMPFEVFPVMEFRPIDDGNGYLYTATRRVGPMIWIRNNHMIFPTFTQNTGLYEEAKEEKYFLRVALIKWQVPNDDTNCTTLGWRHFSAKTDPEGKGRRVRVSHGSDVWGLGSLSSGSDCHGCCTWTDVVVGRCVGCADQGLPCPLEAAGFDQGADGQNSLSADDPPAHAGALHALCHQGLVGSLDHA